MGTRTPPPRRQLPAQTPTPAVTFSRGIRRSSWKVGIYGPEGVGKSSLASLCPGIKFIDAEYSTDDLDVERVDGIACEDFAESWTRLRSFIQSLSSGIWALDTMSRIEDWCATFVIKSKPSNEGAKAKDSLEDYKYKAGLTFVCDEFRRLLGDIDNAYRRGASFVLIAHNRISRVKNPDGSDFIRQEPRLLDDPKGSNMLQFVSFVDNLLFVDLDKSADKGKVVGSGSRTIYLDSSPSRLSKTRTLPRDPMDFQEGSTELWTMLGVK